VTCPHWSILVICWQSFRSLVKRHNKYSHVARQGFITNWQQVQLSNGLGKPLPMIMKPSTGFSLEFLVAFVANDECCGLMSRIKVVLLQRTLIIKKYLIINILIITNKMNLKYLSCYGTKIFTIKCLIKSILYIKQSISIKVKVTYRTLHNDL